MASVEINYRKIHGEKVAAVTINRLEKMNALNSGMVHKLKSAFELLSNDCTIRAVILGSAGDKAWVGGADIKEMARLCSRSKARDFIQKLHKAMLSIRNYRFPL